MVLFFSICSHCVLNGCRVGRCSKPKLVFVGVLDAWYSCACSCDAHLVLGLWLQSEGLCRWWWLRAVACSQPIGSGPQGVATATDRGGWSQESASSSSPAVTPPSWLRRCPLPERRCRGLLRRRALPINVNGGGLLWSRAPLSCLRGRLSRCGRGLLRGCALPRNIDVWDVCGVALSLWNPPSWVSAPLPP